MSRHQKRLSVPPSWPIERKTETFTTKAGGGPHGEAGVPLLIVLRDVLGYVDSRKEARVALNNENIRVNGIVITDERRPIGMFDIVSFAEREEHYRVFPDEGGRLALTEIPEDAAQSKLGKLLDKRDIAGGKTQLNLHDGQNLLVEDGSDYAGGDSIVVANEDDEIVAHFPFEEGSLVTAVAGQHAGEIGEVAAINITAGSSPNTVRVEPPSDLDVNLEEPFESITDYVVVIDENFIGGED